MAARQKAVAFIEAFTAGAAYIPSLSKMQVYILSKSRDILYFLDSVIVDTISFLPADRAFVFPAGLLDLQVKIFSSSLTFFTFTSSNPSSFEILSE